jgi:hypothetical protein
MAKSKGEWRSRRGRVDRRWIAKWRQAHAIYGYGIAPPEREEEPRHRETVAYLGCIFKLGKGRSWERDRPAGTNAAQKPLQRANIKENNDDEGHWVRAPRLLWVGLFYATRGALGPKWNRIWPSGHLSRP